MLLAKKHPTLFSRLSLLGPNCTPADFLRPAYRQLEREYKKDPHPLLALMLREPDILPEALNLRLPVMVCAGQHDCFTRASFRRLCHALPDARLHILSGHTHSSYVVGSDYLAPYLLDFFGT